tara:strand:- start:456 stop:1367 length:912 start_codon:yes stop_codon:yes gene_type:complete
LNIHFENVNFSSNSGPNSFANKLIKYLPNIEGCLIDSNLSPDAHLCFIETGKPSFEKPMFQRLDGIYFNTAADYNLQNRNINRTYNMADGVIFQSEFNRKLITKYFGEHKRSTVIHNGADLATIEKSPVLPFDRYENLWSCAAAWRPHKRLNENIRYFLEHAGKKDGLMIAGAVSRKDYIKHDRIHYAGNLNQKQLYALYKRTKYFLHLAWLDHCPNVVVDARACGCQIICSSEGGTQEIAGKDAIVIKEEEWNFEPVRLYEPPKMNFKNKIENNFNSELCMTKVSEKYFNFIGGKNNEHIVL